MKVLSHVQVAPLLAARKEGRESVEISLDLNRTISPVSLDAAGVVFSDGDWISWEQLAEIAEHENACYTVAGGTIERIQFYSEEFRRVYALRPTDKAPTMLLAGFPMHRIKGIDPWEDTRRKIAAIAPVTGKVLDTATGLGYTAILAAQTATEVTTIELDPTVLEVARRNPWSQDLFDNPKIKQRIGDSFEVIRDFEDGSFNAVFHDPPSMQLAGDLYSEEFYRQLLRVLRRGGKLFHYIGDHYIGDLESAFGNRVGQGALRRLQYAGFSKVTRAVEAFGLVATNGPTGRR
jgi:uncharacterized protein